MHYGQCAYFYPCDEESWGGGVHLEIAVGQRVLLCTEDTPFKSALKQLVYCMDVRVLISLNVF